LIQAVCALYKELPDRDASNEILSYVQPTDWSYDNSKLVVNVPIDYYCCRFNEPYVAISKNGLFLQNMYNTLAKKNLCDERSGDSLKTRFKTLAREYKSDKTSLDKGFFADEDEKKIFCAVLQSYNDSCTGTRAKKGTSLTKRLFFP